MVRKVLNGVSRMTLNERSMARKENGSTSAAPPNKDSGGGHNR